MSFDDQDSGKIHNIFLVLKEIRDLLASQQPLRRKVIVGENVVVDDCTFKEVQAAAGRVQEILGPEYLSIILQRIPTSGLAALKSSEWSRFIRLCRHYLNEPRP